MSIPNKNNPILQAIRDRRSVRDYKNDKVPRRIVEQIIKAGNFAPSVDNLQPWRFVVVEDEGIKEKLRDKAVPKWREIIHKLSESDPERFRFYGKYMGMEDPVYYSAPVIIFVIGLSGINCALACENMMLAAHALGVGSCYVGWGTLFQEDSELLELFELKEKERIFGPILLGFPKKQPEAPKKKEPQVKWI